MNHDQMMTLMDSIFTKCIDTHAKGQKEYADNEQQVFDNFNRIGKRLDLSSEEVLAIYLLKHIDGITSFIKGYKSQREDVRGRITDCIVYLCILWGMIEEKETQDALNTSCTTYPVFQDGVVKEKKNVKKV